jgi:LuxR family maltose regulon positive regulatory protein
VLEALISTKFHNPLTIGRLTSRPRLYSRLDESLLDGNRLVLVTAPAGFGKSTLVSAWLGKQEIPFSWLSLESSENDPGQFLSYFVGALQRVDSSLGMSQVNRIQTADVADSEAVYADVMKNLVIEIAARPDTFILVLDDCHVLKNPLLLKLLNFLIEHQPAQLRLILLSREDLPLPVSRLRVRRQVVEIRQIDLQFTSEEAEDFLREVMGISQLTPNEVIALEERTEGWIAGLQLAGLSIKSDPDPAHFIESFTGSDRFILDYFMEEVFTRQSGGIQNFLLATSILDRFCAPLCDSVLQEMHSGPVESGNGSQATLELLEHSNLFLIPLDYQRKWYRYHHLFADLLRHALAQAFPQKISTLHLRASQWLEAKNFIPEAVQHAFQTQDWTYAADLVERHAWNMIMHSQVGIVSEWCNTFPEAVISKHPGLCIFHGWALIIGFKKDDFPAANIRLEQAKSALADIDPETRAGLVAGAPPVHLLSWVAGQITLLRSFILMSNPRNQANAQDLTGIGQLAYDQLPEEDIPARSAALLDICYASQARSDAEEAEKKYEYVVGVALSGGNYFGAVVAEYHRAHGLFTQGRLRDVITFCQQKKKAYEAYFDHPIQDLPAIALLDQAQGCALLEMNELEQAGQLLRSGLEVGQWMPREELPGYLALARLCDIKGDPEGMLDSLRRQDMRWPDIRYCTEAMRVIYDLKSHPDNPEVRKAAAAWAEAHVPEIGQGIMIPGFGPAFFDEADHAVFTAWIRIQIILGKAREALDIIQPMLAVALEHNLIHRVIELFLLQAQAFYVLGQKDRSWKPLQLALSHAETNGYLRIIDQNPILIRLLQEAMKSAIMPGYIQRVLEINSSERNRIPPSSGRKSSNNGLIEPLSNRETEVLGLMADGLSNSEIAARLYLSTNTLKAHTQNIFGKLGVHNRIQAVNKARDLKLI